MSDNPLHIVFSGGGTGGHLFPGLAVADELRRAEPDARITFAGRGTAFERDHVGRAGYDYVRLACRPLPRGPWQAVRFVSDHMAGYRAARKFLLREQVAAVVGLGGYASVPMARAAAARSVPLVLLEQNAFPGRANTWLAGSATLVCTAFDSTRRYLRTRCPTRVTGTPVRARPATRNGEVSRPRQLLVLGGSQGARVLNQQVPRALYRMRRLMQGWRVVHQSGARDLQATRELYHKLAVPATVVSFIEDLSTHLADTDFAVARAGGSTIAELASSGVAALLIPYPHAADDHQRKNAEELVNAGAAVMIDARAVTGRLDYRLADELTAILDEPARIDRMAQAIKGLGRPHSAWTVAMMVRDLCRTPALAHAG